MKRRLLVVCLAILSGHAVLAQAAAPPTRPAFDSMPSARFEFQGPVGERVKANVGNWLLRAPQANPGMIAMFRVRDRQPVPQLVPWAGEFVGKYLISAVQALRMSDDPRLRAQVNEVVNEFIATQADDGYLGPFPKQDRLLKNWDLWGHYHAITALLLWDEQTGDRAAFTAARRAADLVCATYLDTGRRVFDAGDPEMNMAILTALAKLHRLTGEPRYLRMAREVEKDWERTGDYLRAGLDGREFFQSPRPRWESLHDLQGLVELWQITGEAQYRRAFVHHWRSIRRWDVRNTGGFSSGEQATGNPYAPTAIETCCTVAWMALTVDYLRLTGDARAADDLELATLNAGLGAQHPSGRWCTYNTPMDGVREASAHTIVFQARAGTPELNCCSVNGSRVLGLLGEWALMSAPDGLVLNWLGPMRATTTLADGTPVGLEVMSHYPVEGQVVVRVEPRRPREFTLRLRVPDWASGPAARLNGRALAPVTPGRYLALSRRWKKGDTIQLTVPVERIRVVPGANEAAGKVSLYRGPLLLAWDQRFNTFDEDAIPSFERVIRRVPTDEFGANSIAPLQPWVVVEARGAGDKPMRLVDFATAGTTGTRYRTWLPSARHLPTPAVTQLPADGQRLAPGPVRFQWRGERAASAVLTGYRLRIFAPDRVPDDAVFETALGPTNRVVLDLATQRALAVGGDWLWRVESLGPAGESWPDAPPARFTIDPAAPPQVLTPEPRLGPNGEIIAHSLRRGVAPAFGELKSVTADAGDDDGTLLNGQNQMIVYAVPGWPEDDFTLQISVKITKFPTNRIGQIFSAWCAPMDDPLRLVVDGGKLFARVEAGAGFSTPGVPIAAGERHDVAAVKQGGTLTLYVDGTSVGSCGVPEVSMTQARDCALGGNPHYGGNEFLAARFADFRLLARALSAEVIAESPAAR